MANNTTHTGVKTPFFDELDSFESTLFVMEMILFVPTVFGNSLILISIFRFKWLQSPVNLLIGNMALSDLLMGVCLIPMDVIGTFLGLNRFKDLCLVQLSLLIIFLLMSLVSMLAISIERYASVRFPWKHRSAKKLKFVCIFIPASWITVVAFGIVPICGWNNVGGSGGRCEHLTMWNTTYRYIVNTAILVLVSVNMIIFFLVVDIALKKLPKCTDQEDENKRIRHHLAKTYLLIFVSAIFIVCWMPYCILTFFSLFINWHILDIAQGWTLLLGLFNCSLNWLIYGLKNHKFRKAFGMLLCNTCKRKRISRMQMPSTTS